MHQPVGGILTHRCTRRTLAAFLDAIPYFAGHNDNGQLCSFMGFMMTWFDWAVLAWVSCCGLEIRDHNPSSSQRILPTQVCCITHKLGVNILYQRESKLFDLDGCCGKNPILLALVNIFGKDAVESACRYSRSLVLLMPHSASHTLRLQGRCRIILSVGSVLSSSL